ncbi:hypothetical protein H4Q26_012804 [Puccinia striiformis f. sp. tritici PST-130]|nr:hypothetical protein H4Q26_012804 [Puccinia striiformis f. sp. tritici PST-130]
MDSIKALPIIHHIQNIPRTPAILVPILREPLHQRIQVEEPTPVTSTPFYMALEPLVDVSTEAFPIIRRDSYRKAQTQLLKLLAAASLASSIAQQSGSIYQCSESSSSCASSIISTRAPSLIESIKSWIAIEIPDYGLPLTPRTFGFNYCRLQAFNAGSPLRLHHEHWLINKPVHSFAGSSKNTKYFNQRIPEHH